MTLKQAIKHNIKCWKKDITSLELRIAKLQGEKNQLEDNVECLELVLEEQESKLHSG